MFFGWFVTDVEDCTRGARSCRSIAHAHSAVWTARCGGDIMRISSRRNFRQLLHRISRSKVESGAYGKTQISAKKNVSPSMPSDESDAATPKKSTPPPDFKSDTVFEEKKAKFKIRQVS